jgi:hypothetical protein
VLGMKKYTRAYIDASRARVDAHVTAYKKLVAAAEKAGTSQKALDAFDSTFFNNMVLVLDHLFVHRLRTIEGKDGNALNEVRILGDSIMLNGGTMSSDRSIKLKPESSILGYGNGDEIKLKKADFEQLAKAFFAEIEDKYL